MEANVDLIKLKTSDWLKIGGAIGFFIFGFFHWTTVSLEGFGSTSGNNVFDFFLTGTIPWILVIATGVITFLLAMGMMKPGNVPWPFIMLVATGLAALLLLIRLLFNPVGDQFDAAGVDVGRGIGLILSAISGFVAFGGAVMGFKESGGEFSDLTDMDKIKASFGGGSAGSSASASPPPPPPPGMAPPPPPPPPA